LPTDIAQEQYSAKEIMAEFNILISDNISPVCTDIFTSAGLQVDYSPGLAPDGLLNKIPAYHGLIVRSATKVTREVIEAGRELKAIGRAGTGVDNIDLQAATERGIAVFNSRGGNTISAAEHAFALMMSLARNIPAAHGSMKNGKWERKKFAGVELYQKILGVVGFGQIGREVARRARAFDMQIIAFDPLIPEEVFASSHAENCSLEEVFRQSDFITIHVPLLPETRHLIGTRLFEICKPSLRLINASRGGVVDEAALFKALKSGVLAGAALDVFESEPPGNLKLLNLDNFVATPHLGASTREGQDRVASEIAQTVAAYLKDGQVSNLVNEEILGK